MSLNSGSGRPIPLNGTNGADVMPSKGKLEKKSKHKEDGGEQKKRVFFSSKK